MPIDRIRAITQHTDKQPRTDNDSEFFAICCRESGDRRTDGPTDGRYLVHYLPRFKVDQNEPFVDKTMTHVIL